MEILTRHGRFAAECAKQGHLSDPDTLVVRSRSLQEMQGLRQMCPKLQLVDVVESVETGWVAEMRLPKAMWCHVVEELVLDMDYTCLDSGQRTTATITEMARISIEPAIRRAPRQKHTEAATPGHQAQLRLWAA